MQHGVIHNAFVLQVGSMSSMYLAGSKGRRCGKHPRPLFISTFGEWLKVRIKIDPEIQAN